MKRPPMPAREDLRDYIEYLEHRAGILDTTVPKHRLGDQFEEWLVKMKPWHEGDISYWFNVYSGEYCKEINAELESTKQQVQVLMDLVEVLRTK